MTAKEVYQSVKKYPDAKLRAATIIDVTVSNPENRDSMMAAVIEMLEKK